MYILSPVRGILILSRCFVNSANFISSMAKRGGLPDLFRPTSSSSSSSRYFSSSSSTGVTGQFSGSLPKASCGKSAKLRRSKAANAGKKLILRFHISTYRLCAPLVRCLSIAKSTSSLTVFASTLPLVFRRKMPLGGQRFSNASISVHQHDTEKRER